MKPVVGCVFAFIGGGSRLTMTGPPLIALNDGRQTCCCLVLRVGEVIALVSTGRDTCGNRQAPWLKVLPGVPGVAFCADFNTLKRPLIRSFIFKEMECLR